MKRPRTIITALALAALVALTGAQGGCHNTTSKAVNPAGNGAAYNNPGNTYPASGECTATPDQVNSYPTTNGTGVRVEKVGGRATVIGSVWISCAPSPVSQITTVELYFKTRYSSWELVKEITSTIIPISSGTEFGALFLCAPGTYSIHWSVVGEDSLDEPMTHSEIWPTATVSSGACAHAEASPVPVQTGDGPVMLG